MYEIIDLSLTSDKVLICNVKCVFPDPTSWITEIILKRSSFRGSVLFNFMFNSFKQSLIEFKAAMCLLPPSMLALDKVGVGLLGKGLTVRLYGVIKYTSRIHALFLSTRPLHNLQMIIHIF